MKKMTILSLLLILSANLFSQQTTSSPTFNKQDYLQKSKNQKTAAWVLLGGGIVLMGSGFLIGDRKESSFSDAGTGVVIGGIGFLATIGSIPFINCKTQIIIQQKDQFSFVLACFISTSTFATLLKSDL